MSSKESKLTMEYDKLVIFDLDGVLLESRELHYEALNRALKLVCGESIGREEHLSVFDGLPTNQKLKMLAKLGRVSDKYHTEVAQVKQEETKRLLEEIEPDLKLIDICQFLDNAGYKIAVASNSVRGTVKTALSRLGMMPFVEIYVSNEDVRRAKPYPEMYWKCMQACNAVPRTTIIIEDSHIGRQGAIDSGATLLPVKDPEDLTIEKVAEAVEHMEAKPKPKVPWRDKNLTVVIPMSGAGSRFANAGYTFPKPLIEVRGKPMIQVVLDNLNVEAGHYIFIVQKSHREKYALDSMLNRIIPSGAKITLVDVDGLTEGAACSVLMAKKFIDHDGPILMANSDQYVEWNANECLYAWSADQITGGILTFRSTHPKWSYARLDDKGFVAEVAEKKVISDNATVGIYYWKHGRDFVKYAEQMIAKNIRVNGEFYVAPVFNEAILDGQLIRIKEANHMWGIGTPEDLEYFLRTYEGDV
jgi:beta-phosphoglucomutase-like phosphatase (HAD superfamily)/dTDP-glucose pyrophosphorylase